MAKRPCRAAAYLTFRSSGRRASAAPLNSIVECQVLPRALRMSEADLKVLVAVTAAAAAIVVALISFVSTRSNQRDVERLKADLADRKGEADARRTYTCEALQRLYRQYEPIRFHLVEACESAQDMIAQLAELASVRTPNDVGTLPRGNYLRVARVYHLLLPAVYFKVMQSRLTLVDLEASRPTFLQYLLAKQACSILTRDREIAGFFGLTYTPYVTGWRELRAESPQRYRRQGFPLGRFENALNAFLTTQQDGQPRVLSFGDFEALLASTEHLDYNTPLGAAIDLFDEFEPDTRPVLWRTLLCQVVMYRLFIRAVRSNVEDTDELRKFATQFAPWLFGLGVSNELGHEVLRYITDEVLSRIDASYTTPNQ